MRTGPLFLFAFVASTLLALADPATNAAPAAPLPPAPTAHIGHFQGDRPAAISYTLDDGTHDQLQVVPMLKSHGWRGTFLIIASCVPNTEAEVVSDNMGTHWGSISWEKLRELQADGFEMSSHSWAHSHLPSNPDGGRAEVEKADQLMALKLGAPPLTFCYPWNDFNEKLRAIVLEHHVNDRSECFGFGGPTFTQDAANEWVDGLIHDQKWGVPMIHNVNNTDPNATSLTVLNGQMDYAKSRADSVWVDTFLNVSLYTKERDAAQLTVTMIAPRQASILLTCPLSETHYHFPLTVVVGIPGVGHAMAGFRSVIFPEQLPVKIGKDTVQFDTVPGPEPVILTWGTTQTSKIELH